MWVFEVFEPHVGAEGDSVFFEEVGWVVGIWGLLALVRGEVGEGAEESWWRGVGFGIGQGEGEDCVAVRRGVFEPFGRAYDREASTHFFFCVCWEIYVTI